MQTLTYKQAYDKIIEAYFKDEIKPYNGQFCFCGTLAGFVISNAFEQPDNYRGWPTNEYSSNELNKMEVALLYAIYNGVNGTGNIYEPFAYDMTETRERTISHPNYENALFAGMCAALEVLKDIHRARNENVDEVPVFTKRNLKTPA
jgi:hypothetical protein